MNKSFYWEFARSLRRALRRPIPNHKAFQDLVRGKEGIEIGGPSELFRRVLPIYSVAKSLDGVNFSSTTVWEGQLSEGSNYPYVKGGTGRQIICDATDLSRLPSQSYDFLLSSNNLEHIANPLKAVAEWFRILRPGGCMLLVLPRKESNFDHRREVTKFEHLLQDLELNTSEHDLTHLDEILDRHDYARDPPAVDRETMLLRSRKNFENRCLHHHVFDLALITAVFEHFQTEVVMQATTRTDYIAAARKR